VDELNGVYKEIAENMGIETAVKFYNYFKGMQITFPVKLVSRESVSKRLFQEYDGNNLREIAQKYGYSERWTRSLIDEYKQNECNESSNKKK